MGSCRDYVMIFGACLSTCLDFAWLCLCHQHGPFAEAFSGPLQSKEDIMKPKSFPKKRVCTFEPEGPRSVNHGV